MIESLTMPATAGINPILFPKPAPGNQGTVTVLCGPNGGGKSFILKTLVSLLNDDDEDNTLPARGWILHKTGEAANFYRARHHATTMRSAGILGRTRAGSTIKETQPEKYARLIIFGALLASLPQLPKFDRHRWMVEPIYRQGQIGAVGAVDEEQGYWFGTGAPSFVSTFNSAVRGRLGLRVVKDGLELVLSQGEGASSPYPNWSDGQKSLFTILAVTEMLRPEVFVFDEIENFLHPALVSVLVQHLKQHCRQTILSTHHPHLVFGTIIDTVYYVERSESAGDPPQRLLKYHSQPAVQRRISLLSDDRSKLASLYRLFDVKDAALLATGAMVLDALDLELHAALSGHFECGAVGAKSSIYMDRQSEQIGQLIRSFSPTPNVVMDWGAGIGRSPAELAKRVSVVPTDHHSWILYDPDPANEAPLARLAAAHGHISVVHDRSSLTGIEAGVFLLTNVLHVLDPNAWCEAIEDGWNAIRHSGRGIILITEIYPLLAAESRAIPIPPNWAVSLFRELGFKATVRHFSSHGTESYCIAVSQPPSFLHSREALLNIVVAHWEALKTELIGEYEGIGHKLSMGDHQRLLNSAFGLARITSCLRAIESSTGRSSGKSVPTAI